MTTMLEKMARAIDPSALIEDSDGCVCDPPRRDRAFESARAALMAMREPTEAVLLAGAVVNETVCADELRTMHAHMIDAILSESNQPKD